MAHSMILGMTESGKTTLAKRMAKAYRKKGWNCIVLDPLSDPEWEAAEPQKDYGGCFQTRNQHEFLETVKASRSCMVFVDEAGEAVGQYDNEMHWLGTRGRHYGHSCHFISQRAQQIAKTVRDQCATMYLFASSLTDCKIHADEWNEPEIKDANKLDQGEFFIVRRFGELERMHLWRDQ